MSPFCSWNLQRHLTAPTNKRSQMCRPLSTNTHFHYLSVLNTHDDVIKWKHFPRYWPFVRGIHRSPVNSPHKGQWRAALIFSLICAQINGWVNNCEAGDLRRNCAHYDVIVMWNCNGLQWTTGMPLVNKSLTQAILTEIHVSLDHNKLIFRHIYNVFWASLGRMDICSLRRLPG